MRYRCLVLDHDDTVMDSTATVHYPAFLDALDQLRPTARRVTLAEYFQLNHHPGFMAYCERTLHFTPEDFDREYAIWQSWTQKRAPLVFPAMGRVIRRQKELGGLLCVVSHSVDTSIRRDYLANGLPAPDLVFGWEQPPERRKPSVWPLQEIMSRLGCGPEELLMVDDLRPGLEMARHAGVDFAAALWGNPDPGVRAEMRQAAPLAFEQPEALEHWLFDEPASQL